MGMAKGVENLHVITYDIPTRATGITAGLLSRRPASDLRQLDRGRRGRSVYTLARVTEDGARARNLVRITTRSRA
jgi:hypothetical protein